MSLFDELSKVYFMVLESYIMDVNHGVCSKASSASFNHMLIKLSDLAYVTIDKTHKEFYPVYNKIEDITELLTTANVFSNK